ncbi:hypothetical protein ACFW1A_01815 [Kitasatospora sp. NPDC058965]|uniref:hypothetical protein n=1 Tax=Kitasatospora sp. NPDC058965 TaxID=3346682 RepID=UPI0036969686
MAAQTDTDTGPDEQAPGERPVPGAEPGRAARKPRLLRRLWRRRSVRVVLALCALFAVWLSYSLGSALLAPGNDSVQARVAEWARDHHLGPLVTGLETAQYKMNPPKVGGRPTIALNQPPVAGPSAGTRADESKHTQMPTVAPITPAPLVSPAGDPLPGEGSWRVIGNAKGVPAVQSAMLRPDNEHTSYLAGVVSMDQRLVRFQLHPGTDDPGDDNWGVPPNIPPQDRNGLLASFNGGFKVRESGGGFFLNGVTHGSLTDGSASLVFYKDGHVTVGAWNNGVSMAPDVVGVRQNLRPIVDHGQVPDDVDHAIESGWGLTIGGKFFVWRSGAGVTPDGRLIYAYGPALSVRTLAELLHQAGCVEAMQLDINPAWMSFNYYEPTKDPVNPNAVKLLPDQERPADRYFEPTSRDFTAVYAR